MWAGRTTAEDQGDEANPVSGTTNARNVYPGPTVPFGMVAFSPEMTALPGKRFPIAAPGGYEWRSNGVRGFSLTHVNGTGCTGASGDIPLMPVTLPVELSPSSADAGVRYTSLLDHAKETASPGAYTLTPDNGVAVSLAATARTDVGQFQSPADKPPNLQFCTFDSEVGSSDLKTNNDPAMRIVRRSGTSGNPCGPHAEHRPAR